MTDRFFDDLYRRLLPAVRKAAKRWASVFRIDSSVDHEDLIQEFWLRVWELPDNLHDKVYLGCLGSAAYALAPKRVRVQYKSLYVSAAPVDFSDFTSMFRVLRKTYRSLGFHNEPFHADLYPYTDGVTMFWLMMDDTAHRILTDREYRVWSLARLEHARSTDFRAQDKEVYKNTHGHRGKKFAGYTQAEIGKMLGIDQATVSRDIKVIVSKFKDALTDG